MLTRRGRRTPARPASPGFTLPELLIVMVVAGVVLGLVVSSGNRLQRLVTTFSLRMANDDQLRGAASLLPLDLRGLSAAAGDIHTGDARDTSLEISATIASAIVCDTAGGELLLVPFTAAGGGPAGATLQSGDVLHVLVDGDSEESWRRVTIRSIRPAARPCPMLAAMDDEQMRIVAPSSAVYADVGHAVVTGIANGSAVRAVRVLRYSVYRAGDGHWYLGLRNATTAIGPLTSVQPVSGPFVAPTAGGGTRFRYFDAAGDEVPPGTVDTRRITRVEAQLVAAAAGVAAQSAPRDSLAIVVALRNTR